MSIMILIHFNGLLLIKKIYTIMNFILSVNGSLVEPKITDCFWMCYQRDLRNVYLSEERIFESLLDLCKLKPLLLGAYFLCSFVLYWPDWTFFLWFNPVSLNVSSRPSFTYPDKLTSSKPHSHASSKLPHVEKGTLQRIWKMDDKMDEVLCRDKLPDTDIIFYCQHYDCIYIDNRTMSKK